MMRRMDSGHGDAHCAEALADGQEHLVHARILQRMVNLAALALLRDPQGQGRDPLPVAVMAQVDGAGLATKETFVHTVGALEDHAAANLLLADGEQFDGLHRIVAKPMVEVFLYLPQVGLRAIGEGAAQVFHTTRRR